MHKCFLLAKLEGDRIVGVMVCGEKPWTMTKHYRDEYVIVAEGTGKNYEDARDNLRDLYPEYVPQLAARFPFPE